MSQNKTDTNIDIEIRNLKREDLDQLLSLYTYLHPEDDPLPGREQVERIWDKIVSDESQIYEGAFVNGKLISACNATVVPNLTRGARPFAVIENVITHPHYRRKGIGSQVMKTVLDTCRETGCYKVMLMSSKSRSEIHGFYESLGFDRNSKQAFVIKYD